MFDLIDSVLSMQLDVYRQSEIQDPDTGAIKREWTYHRTVDCHAKGVISNSSTTRSSDKQVFSNKYIKNISTFDWDFEYTSEAYAGTGNAYADRLLANYVMVSKVEII